MGTRGLVLVLLFFAGKLYGQPLITEDRMILKVSKEVVKLEEDIYHPGFKGQAPKHFIRWEYIYRDGLLTSERSFPASKLSVVWSDRRFEYDKEGRLLKDSSGDPDNPQLDDYTTYEYNNGQLVKATRVNKLSREIIRLDLYKKYKNATTYRKESQFYGDEGEKTVHYTSFFENGLKQSVIFKGGFAPVFYSYDSTGALKSINKRKIFYKIDERGNPVASVAFERGMRIYSFIRLTYMDGLITGSLDPDRLFIEKWDNEKL